MSSSGPPAPRTAQDLWAAAAWAQAQGTCAAGYADQQLAAEASALCALPSAANSRLNRWSGSAGRRAALSEVASSNSQALRWAFPSLLPGVEDSVGWQDVSPAPLAPLLGLPPGAGKREVAQALGALPEYPVGGNLLRGALPSWATGLVPLQCDSVMNPDLVVMLVLLVVVLALLSQKIGWLPRLGGAAAAEEEPPRPPPPAAGQ